METAKGKEGFNLDELSLSKSRLTGHWSQKSNKNEKLKIKETINKLWKKGGRTP
jgi:hypothetical protein